MRMSPLRRLSAILAFAALMAPAVAAAAVRDAVLNKEGVWSIDVDKGACAVSRILPDGTTFLFRAHDGQMTFGFFASTPQVRGVAGRLETDAAGFGFPPSYDQTGSSLYFNGDFDARVLAALRAAHQLRVLIDGRPVVAMALDGTGFAAALDDGLACSRGKRGWWGDGVKPKP
jgi:hypothetical protein